MICRTIQTPKIMKRIKALIAPLFVLAAIVLAIIVSIFQIEGSIDRFIIGIIAAIVFVGIGSSIYVLPSFIAGIRNSSHYTTILLINLFGGWTGLGWLAVLIWAIVEKPAVKNSPPQIP